MSDQCERFPSSQKLELLALDLTHLCKVKGKEVRGALPEGSTSYLLIREEFFHILLKKKGGGGGREKEGGGGRDEGEEEGGRKGGETFPCTSKLL